MIDGRADVFSLGATLYTMAFGHNPFEHPSRGFEKLALLNGNVTFPEHRTNAHGVNILKGSALLLKECCGQTQTDGRNSLGNERRRNW